MRRFFLIVFGLILCLVAGVAGYVSYRLYLILPDNTAPSQAEYPQAAIDLLRLDIIRDGGIGADIRRENRIPENFILAYRAARMLFQRLSSERYERVQRGWHVNATLAALWVYLRWSQVEILTTILHDQKYGPRAEWQGLDEASQGFFGVSAIELSIPEIAVLIINTQAFSNNEPWCNRQRVEEKVLKLLGRYKEVFPDAKFDAEQMFSRLKPAPIECKA